MTPKQLLTINKKSIVDKMNTNVIHFGASFDENEAADLIGFIASTQQNFILLLSPNVFTPFATYCFNPVNGAKFHGAIEINKFAGLRIVCSGISITMICDHRLLFDPEIKNVEGICIPLKGNFDRSILIKR